MSIIYEVRSMVLEYQLFEWILGTMKNEVVELFTTYVACACYSPMSSKSLGLYTHQIEVVVVWLDENQYGWDGGWISWCEFWWWSF